MRIQNRHQAVILALLVTCVFVGCGTKMTAPELETHLNRESRTVSSRQAMRRVFPVHAQTKMEAWLVELEAKSEPQASDLSLQLADGFRLGQLRRIDYVVGGPFPGLSDQLVLNGLLLNEDRSLPGLRIVLVSPTAPTPELRRAASVRLVRLEHRMMR